MQAQLPKKRQISCSQRLSWPKDEQFKNYLVMRAEALLTDNYQPSDYAWMDVRDNLVDVIIGPIETYEDRLFGYLLSRPAFEILCIN